MFTSGLSEDTKDRISLYDVEDSAVSSLVAYMYTAEISISNDNVQDLFSAANLFEMLPVCEMCARHMMSQLNMSNVVALYQFASRLNSQTLLCASRDFIINHFLSLITHPELYSLDYEEFSDIVRDDDLNVDKEERVFEAIMTWIENDLDSRCKFVSKLMKHVRFTLMEDDYIESSVMTNEIVMTDTYYSAIVSNIRTFKLMGDTMGAEEMFCDTDINGKPRLGMFNTEMFVFVGGSQDPRNRALTCYDPTTKKNYYAIPLHVNYDYKYRIDHHRIVVTPNNDIYLAGGIFYEDHHFEEDGPALNEFKLFNPHQIRWERRANLLTGRCAHVLQCVQDRIYAIGGKTGYPRGPCLDSVECYDEDTDSWSYMSPMPQGLCHHNAVVHGDKILVLGGLDLQSQACDTFLQYCTETDAWTSIQPTMRTVRAEFGMALCGDKLYVIGGSDGNMKMCSMEVFDLNTRRWVYGTDFPEDRKSMVTAVFGDCIYVCGGTRTIISRYNLTQKVVETKDLWKYDPSTGFWTKEAKLVQYANIHACVVAQVNTRRLHESEFVSAA